MKSRTQSSLGIFLTVFGIASGLCQTLALPLPLRVTALGLALLAFILALLFFRRARHNATAIAALSKLTRRSGTYTVSTMATEAEVREIWRVDVESFPDHSIPLELGLAWWKRYPSGVYTLSRDGELLGYISFWPLSERTFKDFCAGRRLENQLSARCICPQSQSIDNSWWYIGSITLLARFRRTKAVRHLLKEALADWLSRLGADGQLNLCALAYSGEGESLLRHFGFHRFADETESPHRLPVYTLVTSPGAFAQATHSLLGERPEEPNIGVQDTLAGSRS